MRLIATSIIVLAGSVCFGLASSADPTARYAKNAVVVGGAILLIGFVCFVIEFARSSGKGHE